MALPSTIYDAILSRLQTLYPSPWMRLTNSSILDENPTKLLRQGYGVAFGSGDLGPHPEVCDRVNIQRAFNVSLTRQIMTMEFAAGDKADIEKQLFEDQRLLIRDLHQNPKLLVTSGVNVASFGGDAGIEFVIRDKQNFAAITSVILVSYTENVV